MRSMGQAGRSDRALRVGLLSRVTVAATLTGAAVVHGTVVGEHLSEWAPAGLFFLLLVMLEAGLGVLALLDWSRSVALLVIVSGLGTVAIWAVSRTVGMPIGPADFRIPEEVGAQDVVCGVLELVAVGVCAVSLARPGRARLKTVPRGRARLAPIGTVVAATALLTAYGVAPAMSGAGHHHGDGASSQSAHAVRAPAR